MHGLSLGEVQAGVDAKTLTCLGHDWGVQVGKVVEVTGLIVVVVSMVEGLFDQLWVGWGGEKKSLDCVV